MNLLHHGTDRSVIALWLGHETVETTSIYLQADMHLKEQALAKTTVSVAAFFDGPLSKDFDGLPTSASRAL